MMSLPVVMKTPVAIAGLIPSRSSTSGMVAPTATASIMTVVRARPVVRASRTGLPTATHWAMHSTRAISRPAAMAPLASAASSSLPRRQPRSAKVTMPVESPCIATVEAWMPALPALDMTIGMKVAR